MSTKPSLDSNYDLEQQFILRMPPEAARNLATDIESGVSFKENFTIELKPDLRHSVVRYNGQVYQGKVMDLPCIMESLKTTDRKTFYKTADICQLMICTQGEEDGPLRGTAAYLDKRTGRPDQSIDGSRDNREFQFLHGLTPPLKNVLRRRFRKTRKKRFVDMPKIEKEVKQLLRADMQAVSVKWEVLWSEPPAPSTSHTGADGGGTDSGGNSCGLNESVDNHPGANSRRAADDDEDEDEEGARVYPIDRRDVFGEISSSSSNASSSGGSDDEDGGAGAGAGSNVEGSGSEDHDTSMLSATKVNATRDTRGKQRRQDQHLSSQEKHQQVIPRKSPESYDFGLLKNQLAAELLLSDSGDENDDSFCVSGVPPEDGSLDFSAAIQANEDDLQASMAARLVAEASEIDVNQFVDPADIVGADVVDDDDDDMAPGGELLDDSTFFEMIGHRNDLGPS